MQFYLEVCLKVMRKDRALLEEARALHKQVEILSALSSQVQLWFGAEKKNGKLHSLDCRSCCTRTESLNDQDQFSIAPPQQAVVG